jgi:hypothetical protein
VLLNAGSDHVEPDRDRPLADNTDRFVYDDRRAVAGVLSHLFFGPGTGGTARTAPRDIYRAHDLLRDAGHDSIDIGEVVEGEGRVLLKLEL